MGNLKKDVDREIRLMFIGWDSSEVEKIRDSIGEAVFDDVITSSDYPHYNDSDIRIAIKRVLLDRICE